MTEKKVIRLQIYRSLSQDEEDEAKQGEYKEYEMPYIDQMTIMNALDYVHQNYDRSFTYYKSCRIGKCIGCFVEVDGKNKLACTTLAKDGMKIGPAAKRKVIRDLFIEEAPR